MKLVIDIPEAAYNYFAQGLRFADDVEMAIIAIVDGVPLPKGHGRIIDESQIHFVTVRCDENKIDGWQLHHEYVDGTDAPTIIEAESEDKVQYDS